MSDLARGCIVVATLLAAITAGARGPKHADAPASASSLTIYYSRYNREVPKQANIRSVETTFDGTTLSFGKRRDVAVLEGADGLLFAPDGDLLVGAQLDSVWKIKVSGKGKHQSALCDGTGAFHLALDPGNKILWVGGAQPGQLVELPLDPFRDGTRRPLTGDDDLITQVQFIPDGSAFYTSSSPDGVGQFGRIDLNAFVTTRDLTALPGAHAMSYDAHTQTMLLFGEKHILQIDPATSAILSDLDLSAHPALNTTAKNTIDQGTTDGRGLVFAAVNNGWMLLVDFTASRSIGDPGNVVAAALLDSFLDDLAPLSGLGARPPRLPKPPRSPSSPSPSSSAR